MPRKQHVVHLPRDDRRTLTRRLRTGHGAAWADARNAGAAPARWTFMTDEARTRLTHLYPIPVCDTST